MRGGQPGIPLTLTLSVFDHDADCAPVTGAQVDIWHANASGVYSDESANGTSGQDLAPRLPDHGRERLGHLHHDLPRVVPGAGDHIHCKVRIYNGGPRRSEFTSQLFFTDALNAQVLMDSRYSARGSQPDVTDTADRDAEPRRSDARAGHEVPGVHGLRLTVPAGTRAGAAMLRLTLTDRSGNAKTVRKAVRLAG